MTTTKSQLSLEEVSVNSVEDDAEERISEEGEIYGDKIKQKDDGLEGYFLRVDMLINESKRSNLSNQEPCSQPIDGD